MPPKKRGKGGKTIKGTIKKKSENSENELEMKYKRSVQDVTILQDHLALHCDVVLKAQSVSTELRSYVRDVENKLQHERQDRRDVSSDCSRQFKSMQTELTAKVKRLEEEISQLQERLALCQNALKIEKRERERVEQEKESTIAALQEKLENMETEYEKILIDSLDSLTSKLTAARQGWEEKSTATHQEYKELLSDFGLNAMDF